MIPEQIIQTILDRVSITDVIGGYIKIRRQGVNFTGCCPFHNEKTASLVISQAKGIFKCFGCGKSGNVIGFVMEHESLSYPEAVRLMGAKAGVEVPRGDAKDSERDFIKDKIHGINQAAQEYFAHRLTSHPEALTYMEERQLTGEILHRFGIGSQGGVKDSLLTHLKSKGYSMEMMVKAGLIKTDDSGHSSDRFRERVIFPFYDPSGHVVGFTGRILPGQDQKKLSKYLNTAENEVFHKGRILFGLYQGKKAINQAGKVFLVEGNTDVLRFHQKGVENTVGTSGTALTQDHARLIHRYCDNLCLIFDGDTAGQSATLKGLKVCLSQGINTYVASLPQGQDPDSWAMTRTKEQIMAWIEENEMDFISFMCARLTPEMDQKPAIKANLINEIMELVNSVPDTATRELYFSMVCKRLSLDERRMDAALERTPVSDDGLPGLKANEMQIRDKNQVIIYPDQKTALERMGEDLQENYVVYPGIIPPTMLDQLTRLTSNLCFAQELDYSQEDQARDQWIEWLSQLSLSGLNVMVNEGRSATDIKFTPFIPFYMDYLSGSVNAYSPDSKKRNIEKAAFFLAQQDATTLSLLSAEVAKKFSLPKGDFMAILRPYISKAKNTVQQKNEEIMIDEERYVFSIENLPDYVDQSFFNKYKHFAAQNREGKKVFYVFATEFGTLIRVGNFYMEPQFQVYSDDALKNKRIVKLNHADLKESKYVEIPSNDMIEFGAFRKFLFRQGPYLLRNAKTFHLDYILDSIALQFPVAHELSIFGQQPEDFYALSNAIFADGRVSFMNDLGLINHRGKTYYSPSCSVIYADTRRDDDTFLLDRYFTMREGATVDFAQWAAQLVKVFKYNDNGYWTLLMAIMCAFRSDIFPIDRLFTSLMFIGPTECGKSQLAQSIRALYIHPDAPMFNLNSGTDAAFFTIMERFRDVPTIMEEYNDQQINDVKFQGLKSAVYDGEGKAKRLDPKTTGLDFSKVNAIPILLGQEAPMRDDASLANRVVMCHVPKREKWEDSEIDDFQLLKLWEKQGLCQILTLVLSQRQVVRDHYRDHLRRVQKQLREDLSRQSLSFQTRVLNTVTLFLAMCQLIEQRIPAMKLPFSYDQFYAIARQKVITQSDGITNTNRLATFFDIFVQLTEDQRQGFTRGKEYKIETVSDLTIRDGRDTYKTISFDQPQKVLFLRLEVIHTKYRDKAGVSEHLKMTNLQTYLKDHSCYIGNVKMGTFQWENETRFVDESGIVRSRITQESKRTSCIALRYDTDLLGFDLGESQHLSVFKPADSYVDHTEATQRVLEYPESARGDLPY